jgi:hypothetical protein
MVDKENQDYVKDLEEIVREIPVYKWHQRISEYTEQTSGPTHYQQYNPNWNEDDDDSPIWDFWERKTFKCTAQHIYTAEHAEYKITFSGSCTYEKFTKGYDTKYSEKSAFGNITLSVCKGYRILLVAPVIDDRSISYFSQLVVNYALHQEEQKRLKKEAEERALHNERQDSLQNIRRILDH